MIDGFSIIRSLDTKEPSRTFLVKRSDNADAVVLKMSDPQSIEQQVLQQAAHPGICQLLGHSETKNKHYLLLSYYGEDKLLSRVERGITVGQLQLILLQISAALDALHGLGFVHGDLRPEHILLNPNEQPVLIDFDSALKIDDSNIKDSVLTSPAYMSPERIRGALEQPNTPITGASDYYSLGVMAFQLLSGQLPFADESPETVMQSHLHDNVPRLPSDLHALQPMIDALMSKDPEQRIGDQAALRGMLKKNSHDDTLAERVIRSAHIDTQEMSSLFADMRLRPDELARQNRRQRRKRRRRIALQSTIVITSVAVLLAGLFNFRAELVPVVEEAAASLGIIENPALTAAWQEAQSLASDPNQGLSAIVAAYLRVTDMAPDYVLAQKALEETTKNWKQSIASAMLENDLERAGVRLEEAQSVFGTDPELTVLSMRLQNRFRAERLLTSTQSLLRSSGLSDEASAAAAVQAFEEILRISPDHAAAAQGLTDISRHYGQLSVNAAEDGDVAKAIRLLQRATAARSDLRELDQVRQRISEATTIQTTILELLAKAQTLSDQQQLMDPSGENAAELYLQVLATDPDNTQASSGMLRITQQVMTQTQALLNKGDIADAQAMLALAETQGLNATPIANMRERIDSEITLRSQIAVGLEQASVLFDQGFVSAPASSNAVAKLREVLLLDPNNGEARQQLQKCAVRLAEVAQQAKAVGMVLEARSYLAQAIDLQPETTEWLDLQSQW